MCSVLRHFCFVLARLAPAPFRPYVFLSVRACVSVCVCVYVRGLRRSVTRARSYREAILFRAQKRLSSCRVCFIDPSRLQPILPSRQIGFSVFADVVGVALPSNNAMACATLKRSLDFEPPMCRPTKRQRCTPMSISPSSSPPNSSRSEYVSPHFGGDVVPKITAEMLSASLTEEVQRMRRKRQLNMELSENRNLDDSSSDSSSENTFPSSAKDKPLFTFRQVGMICERMLNERESQLREEYDKILNMKLSEQYEAFVKFSNDQLHRRFEAAEDPSYLS